MFHPLTLLFYVPNLCFIGGRMARLFKVDNQGARLGTLFCSTKVKVVN